MEVCRCPTCKRSTYTNSAGQQCHGAIVHSSTRRRHWSKASLENEYGECSLNKPSKKKPRTLTASSSRQEEIVQDSEGDSDHEYDDLSRMNYSIFFFLAWLHVIVGVSQENCRIARNLIISFVNIARRLNSLVSFEKSIPQDVRTITKKLELIPSIERHICCTACYSLYDEVIAPFECGYCILPGLSACGEDLFHSKKQVPTHPSLNPNKRSKKPPLFPHLGKPRSIFVTQDFFEWMRWFLPQVESEIEQWAAKLNSLERVSDFQQS
ncbi:hypothetical protein O181_080657 [Austropuccinia psidii MF-1]|uniref:Uncharacterized protein n=1 Tax=Austropuccinia psidii MF-1 TaxID=1389203 RepID=A0A9Q3IHM7_9BASI|nr:hypothetical protein [Austropuccinia psidii MF-1]